MPNTDGYEAQALRTLVGAKFCVENISFDEFIKLLTEMIDVTNKLDRIKRIIFYGQNKGESKVTINESLKGKHIIWSESEQNIIHAVIGIATESGELIRALKNFLYEKHFPTGKNIDWVNFGEEGGDLCWYMAVMADALGITIGDMMDANIKKLYRRYPKGFTAEKAINRNLKEEREILEKELDNPSDKD